MLDAVLYFFVTIVFTVIILFVFTVISAKNAVKRRNNNPIISPDLDSDQPQESDTESNFDEVENTPEFVRHSDSLDELWEAYDMMPDEYANRGHHQHVRDLQRKFSSASSSSESSDSDTDGRRD